MSAQVVRGWGVALLLLCYPFVIFLFLHNGLPWLSTTLVLAVLFWKIRHRDDRFWWLAGIALAIAIAARTIGPGVISKLTPILIYSGLFYFFWSSLKGTPLIERFARLDFPELPPEIVRYTRRLTMVWAGFFALNILVCIRLALWESDYYWALYNGLIIYFLIGGLVLGEYVWRHIRFPGLEIPSLLQTTRNIIRHGHQIWGQR